MLCEELLEFLRVQLLGGAGKDFDRIEAQRRRLRAAGGKIVPKNKRPAARLGHERDGDGGMHAASMKSEATGGKLGIAIGWDWKLRSGPKAPRPAARHGVVPAGNPVPARPTGNSAFWRTARPAATILIFIDQMPPYVCNEGRDRVGVFLCDPP